MTGYGRAETMIGGRKAVVEIRSLNGKSIDINVKSYLVPRDKELWLRKFLAEKLVRGSVDFYLSYPSDDDTPSRSLNLPLAEAYFSQLKELAGRLSLAVDDSAALSAVLRLPDVVEARKQETVGEEDWPAVEKAVEEAVAELLAFRIREGKALKEDISGRVGRILGFYDEVERYEPERIEAVKSRLRKGLEDLGAKVDPLRFEQELIFYVEKLDINEEKVRLREHCRYFLETLENDPAPGKKLGFIIQEMGREINTTGSKANHAGVQKLVVKMKDELEKIREQSMNLL